MLCHSILVLFLVSKFQMRAFNIIGKGPSNGTLPLRETNFKNTSHFLYLK